MAPRGIKAAKLAKRRGQAKVVEWVTKEYSRGSRDIQVEVTPPKKKKAQRYSNGEKDNSKTASASHEDPLPSMNVDETFWIGEPVIEEEKCSSAPFKWRCSDCFPAPVLCKDCCRESHRQLPFHRVQKWTGTHFIPSWLREVGVSLYLGHSGDLCPNQIVCCLF